MNLQRLFAEIFFITIIDIPFARQYLTWIELPLFALYRKAVS
jgi:hypothetical protein